MSLGYEREGLLEVENVSVYCERN